MAEGFNQTLKWTFGLINSSNKYLTAEQFQGKVTCNGTTLKKKQTWTLERIDQTNLALKSCQNKYLTVDRNGKLDCSGEEVGPDQTFLFETQPDGRIAIKSTTHGRYIGGTGDNLKGYDQVVGQTNLYIIHLAMHPQINLRSVNRKTYVHLQGDELRCGEVIPWGYDAMIILEFHGGRYALRAANTQYLSYTGLLEDELTEDTLFTLVFRDAQVAFKDRNGKYLTSVGAAGTVMSRKDSIGKDELFLIEDSHPQVRLIGGNGKYVSIRDGIEVRANQGSITDSEIFQMEAVDRSDRSGNVKWVFRSNNTKYWKAGATVKSEADDYSDASCHFEIEWMGPFVALKASNGKYVSIPPNGQMSAKSAELTDMCKFVFEFINRPILVLRGDSGFVGVKGSSGTLECNRSQYDVFAVVNNAGTNFIKGANGKFWKIESDGSLSVNGDKPTDFFFELRAHTHMLIVTSIGKFLKGSNNGSFSATGSAIDSSTLWEY